MFNRIAQVIVSDLDVFGLRIQFKVEKSMVSYPNLANIKIYNLSESSRNKIEQEGLEVDLYAGYEDETVPLLFTGDIINVVHQKQGTDWISEIYAGDSTRVLNTSTINKTLAPGATTESMVNELVGKMEGVTKGITEGLEDCLSGRRSLLRSIQLSGNIKDVLKKLMTECGFDASVNEKVLETVQKGFPLEDVPPFVINQESGMIGSPERTEIGINVKNLLLPTLKLARRIEVKSISKKINIGNLFYRKIPPIRGEGLYRIDKLVHTGDTHDNTWETQIIGRSI